MADLSLLEQLCFSTVRIETQDYKSNHFSGTGFLLNLQIGEGKGLPVIVTNKHVVDNMNKGSFIFSEADAKGDPQYNKHFPIIINSAFHQLWTGHPDPNIDLCVMPYNPYIQAIKNQHGKELFIRHFEMTHIPNSSQLKELNIAEEILMIGYPNGLWDSVNNMPIIRKGILATNISLDHNGKREFVIDAACFPGSSGSPVLICNNGGYTDKKGNLLWGQSRLMLLGVLYAGPQLTVTGEVKVVTVPNAQPQVQSVSRIPNNLGYIIKSETLLDFIPILKQKYKL